MKNRSGEKVKLTSIDEMLGVLNEESAMEIEISRIHSFKDHPFKVLDDGKMQDLVDSVKENGVLTPVLIRPTANRKRKCSDRSGKRAPLHQKKLQILVTSGFLPLCDILDHFQCVAVSSETDLVNFLRCDAQFMQGQSGIMPHVPVPAG